MSAELFIFARFHAEPGAEDAVAAAIRAVLPPSAAEEGCLFIDFYRATGDSALFFLHSRWVDEAAFDRHAELPHTIRFLDTVGKLIDHPLDIVRSRKFV
jgi:quinol monooxygenase YgiN